MTADVGIGLELDAECSASAAQARTTLDPDERLYFPHRKRLSYSYVINQRGTRDLHIDYGRKEIIFDDERFFAFAEHLVDEPSFTGCSATTWGAGYHWEELRPLLETLLDDGLLQRGDGDDDPRGGGLVPSLVPPSRCPAPRCWSVAECESITRDLAGRAVEIGHVEAFVPTFRIPHPALDADDRQVGEANVFPARLRLDRATEWRVCQYAGSRYHDQTPMNITALKAMIKHWKPMMAVILEVRAEIRRRLQLSDPAGSAWTIGELYLLSSVVLALPAFQLMQRGGGSPQVPVHPVMSSLFRVTDGIRMTTYEMLFRVEQARRPDEPMTGAELYAHAEQEGIFIGDTGVCAGPKHMIDEFLATVECGTDNGFTGVAQPPEVAAVLAELPAAIDYGLHGLQTWGVSLEVWLAMSQAHEAILAIVERVAAEDSGAHDVGWTRLRDRLRADWKVLEKLQITLDHDRHVHHRAYVYAYEDARRALRSPLGRPTHAEEVAPVSAQAMHRAAADQLRGLLAGRLPGHDAEVHQITEALVDYLRREQAIVTSVAAIQAAINELLDRPRPTRALAVRDLQVQFSLGGGAGSFPYLFDALDQELGVSVACTASAIEISDRRTPAST